MAVYRRLRSLENKVDRLEKQIDELKPLVDLAKYAKGFYALIIVTIPIAIQLYSFWKAGK